MINNFEKIDQFTSQLTHKNIKITRLNPSFNPGSPLVCYNFTNYYHFVYLRKYNSHLKNYHIDFYLNIVKSMLYKKKLNDKFIFDRN